jgi:hypothetical protein
MSFLELGDTLRVIVWRESLEGGNALGYPVEKRELPERPRVAIIDGKINTVAQIRIESITPNEVIGRVLDEFEPGTLEWKTACDVLDEVLDTHPTLDTEVIEQSNEPRLTIRSESDYENQWKKQKQKVLDELPDRD